MEKLHADAGWMLNVLWRGQAIVEFSEGETARDQSPDWCKTASSGKPDVDDRPNSPMFIGFAQLSCQVLISAVTAGV